MSGLSRQRTWVRTNAAALLLLLGFGAFGHVGFSLSEHFHECRCTLSADGAHNCRCPVCRKGAAVSRRSQMPPCHASAELMEEEVEPRGLSLAPQECDGQSANAPPWMLVRATLPSAPSTPLPLSPPRPLPLPALASLRGLAAVGPETPPPIG